ncbi:MAG: hypothetical protein OIF58_02065 [Cohaesibacter sp.]|nr:hypothetical protein [Cohaesibacter sp.]
MALAFDATFYLNNNPDVLNAIVSGAFKGTAEDHFNMFGFKENRDPSATFDLSYYLANNPDILAAGINGFQHFIAFGAGEGRVFSADLAAKLGSGFDEDAYLAANADVKAAVDAGTLKSGYQHWILFGADEKRPGAQNKDGAALTATGSEVEPNFTLKTTTDSINGTSANELIKGGISTLNAADVIDGGAGTDTLEARVTGAIGAPTVVAVEKFAFDTIGATTLGLGNVSGVEEVSVTGTGDFEFGASDTLNTMAKYALNDYKKTLTLSFADTALEGQAADKAVIDVSLEKVDGATLQIDLDTGTGTAEIIDNLKIASNGSSANKITLGVENTIDGITKSEVTGSADLTLIANGGAFAAVSKLDASAHTGKLAVVTDTNTVDLSGTKGIDSIALTGTTTGTQNLVSGTSVSFMASTAGANVILDVKDADKAGSVSDSLDINLNAAANLTIAATNNLTVDSVETININSTTSATDKSTVTNTITDLEASTLSTLNVQGDTKLVIAATTDGIDLVDASKMTASFTIDASVGNNAAGKGIKIIGGSAADVITGSNQADIFTLGDGKDTVKSLSGNDTVTDFKFGTSGDIIDLSGAGNSALAATFGLLDADNTLKVLASTTTGAATIADNQVLAVSVAKAEDLDSKAEIAALFGTSKVFEAVATSEEFTLLIAAADTGKVYVYDLAESGANTTLADAGDTVNLVGTLDGVSAAQLDSAVAGNFIA